MGIFFPTLKGSYGRIWPNFELLRALMSVIVTCKYEKERTKNSRERWRNRCLDVLGQETLWSVVGSGRISNSSKILCISSLPASMKRIQSKTAEKKWQNRFSHYNGNFSDAKGQLTPQSVVERTEFRTPPSSYACHCYLQE